MHIRSIHGVAIQGEVILAVALFLASFSVPALAQRPSADSAAQAAAEQARHPGPLFPFHPAPPRGPIEAPVQLLPLSPLASPFVPPRPAIPPAAGSAGVAPIEFGQALSTPVPIRPSFLQGALPRSIALPNPALLAKPYCSPLSAQFNTGSICFNPDLFTINPAFLPIAPYVPPPVFAAAGGPILSLIPPALLLQYCATCALRNAGVPPASPIANPKVPSFSLPRVTPSGPPMILVLKNGTMPLVARYWLGSDWLIHYVTVDGQSGAVPSDLLNLKATGEINYQRGSVFSLPGWPDPQ